MKNPYDVIIRPLLTEKTSALSQSKTENFGGKYVFEVKQGANKVEIKKAIEEIFKVNVVSINVINVRKKARRVGRYEGFRPAVRKAIVTVASDQSLEQYFEV